jgi:hypothetical protein
MMNMTNIEQFALKTLGPMGAEFAKHLAMLLEDNKYDPQPVVGSILPVYWEHEDDVDVTLSPDNIYRPLYYIHMNSGDRNFERNTRSFLMYVSAHLEGCLKNFIPSLPQNRTTGREPFGSLIKPLKELGILTDKLAVDLKIFNDLINVPSKHFSAYTPTRKLNERTFSVLETAYAVVLMRKLSIELFSILKSRGIALPQGWPDFKDELLSWFPLVK